MRPASPSPTSRHSKDAPSGRNHHPRIVLFLGAGASQFAGYRTFADFPQLLFDEKQRAAEGLPPLWPEPMKILQAIKDALERTEVPTTHDNFLWRLDAYTQLLRLNQKDPVLQNYLRDAHLHDLYLLTDAAVDVMAKTTIRHYSTNRVKLAKQANPATYEAMRQVFNLYTALAALNGKDATLPIFTTNYDMLLEDLSVELGDGASIVTGIPGVTEEESVWNPAIYDRPCAAAPIFPLYRLHGCCCWFYYRQGDSDIYFHRTDAAQQSRENLCAMYPGLERERGCGPHGQGFKELNKHLQTCDLVVFIGFSFRDDDVMHVLLKAFADRRGQLKILIVDKSCSVHDVRVRLEKAARRTTLLSRVPAVGEIAGLKTAFGTEHGFSDEIFRECKALLKT